MPEGVQAIFPAWPIASSSSHLTWLQSVGRSGGVRYCRWPRTDRVYGWLGRQLPQTQLGQTSSSIEQDGWSRSKYGWVEPKEVGLTKSHRSPLCGGLLAAPVEGGFGDDFVRRNRPQLRHAAKCLW